MDGFECSLDLTTGVHPVSICDAIREAKNANCCAKMAK